MWNPAQNLQKIPGPPYLSTMLATPFQQPAYDECPHSQFFRSIVVSM